MSTDFHSGPPARAVFARAGVDYRGTIDESLFLCSMLELRRKAAAGFQTRSVRLGEVTLLFTTGKSVLFLLLHTPITGEQSRSQYNSLLFLSYSACAPAVCHSEVIPQSGSIRRVNLQPASPEVTLIFTTGKTIAGEPVTQELGLP